MRLLKDWFNCGECNKKTRNGHLKNGKIYCYDCYRKKVVIVNCGRVKSKEEIKEAKRKQREYGRKYYSKNKEKIREYQKKWKKKN